MRVFFVYRHVRRIRLMQIPQSRVFDPLNLGKSEGPDALGKVFVEHDARAIIAAGRWRRACAAVSTNKRKRGYNIAKVADRMPNIESGLQRHWHAPGEIPTQVRIGAALEILRQIGIAISSGQGVVIQVVRINRRACRAVGYRDSIWAEIENLVERNGHTGASGDG